ncbi:hypothetical protein ACV1OS_002283 [Vibrio cholerae]
MLLNFFLPYLSLCYLASWGLAQNLEGLGLFKFINSQPVQVGENVFYPLNLSPTIGVAGLSLILTVILLFVFLINVRACFYLNKWFGVVGLILWTLPGILSLLDYLPDIINLGPEIFRFEEGFPGSMESAAANLFISLLGGWSVILLIGSFWKKNTFKNAFDHIWYTLGLIAALYFVVDSGLPSYRSDLQEADNRMVRALQLLYTGGENLEQLCSLPEGKELSPSLCAKAPNIKRNILNHLDLDSNLRAKIEPPHLISQLANDPELATQITAINNWACSQFQKKPQCQTIPMDSMLALEDMSNLIVFPTSKYASAVQHAYESMQKSEQRIHEIEQGHNTRYFVFLLLAFLAGGKLANASRSMVKDDRVNPPSWALISAKSLFQMIYLMLKILWKVIYISLCYLITVLSLSLSKTLFKRYKEK